MIVKSWEWDIHRWQRRNCKSLRSRKNRRLSKPPKMWKIRTKTDHVQSEALNLASGERRERERCDAENSSLYPATLFQPHWEFHLTHQSMLPQRWSNWWTNARVATPTSSHSCTTGSFLSWNIPAELGGCWKNTVAKRHFYLFMRGRRGPKDIRVAGMEVCIINNGHYTVRVN